MTLVPMRDEAKVLSLQFHAVMKLQVHIGVSLALLWFLIFVFLRASQILEDVMAEKVN
jgi:hypothetical protein